MQNSYSDTGYLRGHSQVRYDGTAAILDGEQSAEYNLGIFIDIFPYDRIPLSQTLLNIAVRILDHINMIIYRRYYPDFSLKRIRHFIRSIESKYLFFYVSTNTFFKLRDRLFYSIPNKYLSNELSCPTFNTSLINKIRREEAWIEKTVYMMFEGIEVPVPIGYSKILSNQYGNDYMTPKKLPSFHGNVKFDVGKSYRDVISSMTHY